METGGVLISHVLVLQQLTHKCGVTLALSFSIKSRYSRNLQQPDKLSGFKVEQSQPGIKGQLLIFRVNCSFQKINKMSM